VAAKKVTELSAMPAGLLTTFQKDEILDLAAWIENGGGCHSPLDESLFDGKTLDGWEGDLKVWRVVDGAIVGGSMAGNPRNEFLTTKKAYKDFTLTFEYKLVGTEGFVNGGVQVRSKRIANPPNEMSGYQADIGAGMTGTLYDESRRNKALVKANAELIKKLEKPGEWNKYEVRCDGPKIELYINGERTVEWTETDPKIELEGVIGLQIHGACKAEISFRNLRVVAK
jgi:hypothetical protein